LFLLRSFATNAGPGPFISNLLETRNLLGRTAHEELSRRNQPQLHADGVGDLGVDAEMLGPGVLVLLRFLGVEGSNRERARLRLQVADDGHAEAAVGEAKGRLAF